VTNTTDIQLAPLGNLKLRPGMSAARFEPLAKEIKATEGLMERLRKRLNSIEDQLADPKLYERDPKAATQLGKERSDVSAQLARTEEKWLEMSEEYESALAG